jgi:hypothetical protein
MHNKIFKQPQKVKICKTAMLYIFVFENRSYLDEFEAEFKKALARESGARYCFRLKKPMVEKSGYTVKYKIC